MHAVRNSSKWVHHFRIAGGVRQKKRERNAFGEKPMADFTQADPTDFTELTPPVFTGVDPRVFT
jgi:hypothetical protein